MPWAGATLPAINSSERAKTSATSPVAYTTALPPRRVYEPVLGPVPRLAASEHWVPIADGSEPLVALDGAVACYAAQYLRGWPGTSTTTYMRQSVAEALVAWTAQNRHSAGGEATLLG